MKDIDRLLPFILLGNFCNEILCNLKKVDFNDRLQSVCYNYIHGGCKNRIDYEFLVENYRRFQKLSKDNWIICELLK